MRAGFDVVAELAQFFDARPNGGAGHAEFLREFGAGDGFIAGSAQGFKNLGVESHSDSKSSPISTAGAEWVSAPTEMKSTPVWAMAWTPASEMPPLASVWARPWQSCTARRICVRL